MVLKCNRCQFLFSRTEPVFQCPDCGAEFIIEADEVEQREFERIKEEFEEQE